MKKLIIALALVSTSACTTTQVMHSIPVVGNVCDVADGTLVDDKVVYAANALYNVPAQAYTTALHNDQITPALKAILKPKLIALNTLRKAVQDAQGTVSCDFNAMKSLQSEIMSLIPKGR